MAYEIILITGGTQTKEIAGPVSAITTTKIFSGLTAVDGDLLTFGVLKFDTKFSAGTLDVEISTKFYKYRENFEKGYACREVLDYPKQFILKFTEEDYYSLTPMLIFEKVCNWLNNYMQVVAFEINEY